MKTRSTILFLVLATLFILSGCVPLGQDTDTLLQQASKSPRDLGQRLISRRTSAQETQVVIGDGALEGVAATRYVAFKGIPYAQPPVGSLRWRAPQPPTPWTGTRLAKEPAAVCPQFDGEELRSRVNEDCLYLNVWKPRNVENQKLPVMVWIHGGGYVQGTAMGENPFEGSPFPVDFDLYDGGEIVKQSKVLVVSMNYRLGYLGFLAHPALGETLGEGNFGLLDQIAALKWVQENIGAFGGDPNRVTIFGESAGAYSVCALLASPLAKGLYHKAIMESMFCTSRSLSKARRQGQDLASGLGCENSTDVLACMRGKTSEQVLAVQEPGLTFESEDPMAFIGNFKGALKFIPTIDGTVLPDSDYEIVRQGKGAQVPVMIGGNAEESGMLSLASSLGVIPTDYSGLVPYFESIASNSTDLQTMVDFYSAENFKSVDKAFVGFTTDVVMTCTQRQLTDDIAALGNPVYRYVFTQTVPGLLSLFRKLGAFHGAELFYLFGQMDNVPLGRPTLKERALSQNMVQYWTQFASDRSLVGGVTGIQWPQYLPSRQHMTLQGDLRVGSNYRGSVCEAILRGLPEDMMTDR